MAFVSDYSDPSGLGMFSKPGRYTTEKHIIFQKKDEILNNQRKFLKVTSMPNLKMGLLDKERNKDPFEEEEIKPPTIPQKKEKIIQPTFEKSLSRSEVEKIKRNRTQAPPVGFYHPKLKTFYGKAPVLFEYDKEKKKPSLIVKTTTNLKQEVEEILYNNNVDPELLKRKVQAPLPLRVQTARPKFFRDSNNPHEGRFAQIPLPPSSTKSKKVQTFDFRKTMGREKFKFYQSKEYQPDYNPNYDFGRRNLKSPGPTFEKTTPRKPITRTPAYTNEEYYDRALVDLLKPNTSRGPRMDLMLSRENTSSPYTARDKSNGFNTGRSKTSHQKNRANTQRSDYKVTVTSGFNTARS